MEKQKCLKYLTKPAETWGKKKLSNGLSLLLDGKSRNANNNTGRQKSSINISGLYLGKSQMIHKYRMMMMKYIPLQQALRGMLNRS